MYNTAYRGHREHQGNMKLTHNYTSTYQNNMDSANKNKDRHPERFVQMVVAVM